MLQRKVLLVANTDWYLYNFRLALADTLIQRGAEVVLVSPAGPYSAKIQAGGYRWLEWKVGRKSLSPLGELNAVLNLARLYRSEQPELVHHFTIKPVLYGSLAARLAKIYAVVNSVTGLGYIFLSTGLKGRLLRAVTLVLYHLAFAHPNLRVIFENSHDQEVFAGYRLVTNENSMIIPGVGVDTERFQPAPEPTSMTAEEPLLVVFPARMLLDKGLGTLIDAARLLCGRINLRIALVGQPDPGNPATVSEADLRGWQEEGLVEWWGFQDDMEEVYRQAGIVTLPSYGEGLPTVLIEAASSGRPIVATDVQGCREVVQDGVNGLLVPPRDPQALAQALETLARDPDLRKKMGENGRRLVLDRFSGHRIHQETIAVYRTVVKKV
jgi:glycosyltransferase involved in cell wall biosynthesis